MWQLFLVFTVRPAGSNWDWDFVERSLPIAFLLLWLQHVAIHGVSCSLGGAGGGQLRNFQTSSEAS